MATFNQRDGQELFVGLTGSIETITASPNDLSVLADGEIGIFTPAGTRMTQALAATEDRFIIVQGASGTNEANILSSIIDKNDIVSANAKRTLWVDTVEQVDLIGYNGTSGSIEAINDNLYHVRVNLHQSLTSNHGGVSVKHGIYESDSSAAQWEIAQGLNESLVHNFSKETDKQVRPHRLCDEAGVALGTGVGTITVTQGSKYFTANTDIDDATTNAAMVVNGFIRFGTATTDPVYQIVAIDTTNNIGTLDVAYQGASATHANNAVENITNATGIAAEWGITLTGQALPFSVGKINFAVARWTTTLENMGTTTFSSTGATPGTGNVNQMKELEWFVQGNEGDYIRMGEPNLYPTRAKVVDATDYHVIDINTEKIYTGSITAGPIRKTFTIALPASSTTATLADYALTATADDITDVLEVLCFGAAGAEFTLG